MALLTKLGRLGIKFEDKQKQTSTKFYQKIKIRFFQNEKTDYEEEEGEEI